MNESTATQKEFDIKIEDPRWTLARCRDARTRLIARLRVESKGDLALNSLKNIESFKERDDDYQMLRAHFAYRRIAARQELRFLRVLTLMIRALERRAFESATAKGRAQ